jgi:hypothetical protein
MVIAHALPHFQQESQAIKKLGKKKLARNMAFGEY